MRQVAQVGGEDCFFVCYQNYCAHFSKHEECTFCNLVATKKTYDSVLSRKDIAAIGEVAAAAFAEGMCNHILLTGGCFNHEKEVALVASIVERIRQSLGTDTVPGTILPSATTEDDDLRRYRDTGIGAIGYSMEIWDEPLFRAICPGKSRHTSHDEFFAAIERAVRIFGDGNVYGVFVMGLEPRQTFLEGVRALSELGRQHRAVRLEPESGFQARRAPGAVRTVVHRGQPRGGGDRPRRRRATGHGESLLPVRWQLAAARRVARRGRRVARLELHRQAAEDRTAHARHRRRPRLVADPVTAAKRQHVALVQDVVHTHVEPQMLPLVAATNVREGVACRRQLVSHGLDVGLRRYDLERRRRLTSDF